MTNVIDINVDSIIEKLLEVRQSKPGKNVNLNINEINGLVSLSKSLFAEQPIFLEVEAPINVCGDTHGQYHDLIRLFE